MNMLQNRALFGLLILILCVSVGYGQNDSIDRKSSFLVGASFSGHMKHQIYESVTISGFNLEGDFKLGYFVSKSDLLNIHFQTITDTEKSISASNKYRNFNNLIVLNYRRYFTRSFYAGCYFGMEFDYFRYLYIEETSYCDKMWKAGIEFGYTYFFKSDVGIDLSTFYSTNSVENDREITKRYYYSRMGVKIGILYLFKNN